MAPRPLPPLNIQKRVTQYTPRSEGPGILHLSTITADILIGMDPERYGEKEGGAKWMNFWAGLLFERVLEMAWVDKEMEERPELIRPGEVTLGGITGTPDAYDTKMFRPEEYKFTKKSCRQPITDDKFRHYWWQLKAYAKMVGAHSGALYICHVNGNYSYDDKDPESGYIIKPWYDEWTDLELDENWAMLTRHARRRGWLPTVM